MATGNRIDTTAWWVLVAAIAIAVGWGIVFWYVPSSATDGNAIGTAPPADHPIVSSAFHHQNIVDNPGACITEQQVVGWYQDVGYHVYKLYASHLGYLADEFDDKNLKGDAGVVAVHESLRMVQVSVFTGGCEEYRALLPKDETEQVLLMLEA